METPGRLFMMSLMGPGVPLNLPCCTIKCTLLQSTGGAKY